MCNNNSEKYAIIHTFILLLPKKNSIRDHTSHEIQS